MMSSWSPSKPQVMRVLHESKQCRLPFAVVKSSSLDTL